MGHGQLGGTPWRTRSVTLRLSGARLLITVEGSLARRRVADLAPTSRR